MARSFKGLGSKSHGASKPRMETGNLLTHTAFSRAEAKADNKRKTKGKRGMR